MTVSDSTRLPWKSSPFRADSVRRSPTVLHPNRDAQVFDFPSILSEITAPISGEAATRLVDSHPQTLLTDH